MHPTIESQLREFIVKNLLFTDESDSLRDHDSLLANGVVDSIGVMELVEFVSHRFGLEVAMQEITPANFDSISRLAAFIRGRTAARNVEAQPATNQTASAFGQG